MSKIDEAVKELSDKIWNQNGKHTHNELDEILCTALTQAEERGAKKEREKYKPIFQWLFGEIGEFPNVLDKPHYQFRKILRAKLKEIEPDIEIPEPFIPPPNTNQ